MAGSDEVAVWIHELGSFRTRAKARKNLGRCGPAAAAQVLPLLSDETLPENVRWAAIMVVKAWGYAPAAPLLLQVVRTHAGLRGSAIQALEALTGLAIGYAPEEWEQALANPEAYRREHQEPQTLALALADPNGEPDGCRLFRQALGKGYVGVFMQAGAVVMNSGCGPCLGIHEGALGDGEAALSTTNRNFKGRMGNPNSEVYLCSPAVAAASAITGVITNPRKK